MRATAPEKYHDLLIPDFDVGCKRRIFDNGYLESLHGPNLTLADRMQDDLKKAVSNSGCQSWYVKGE